VTIVLIPGARLLTFMHPSESIESGPCDAYRQSPIERLDSLKRWLLSSFIVSGRKVNLAGAHPREGQIRPPHGRSCVIVCPAPGLEHARRVGMMHVHALPVDGRARRLLRHRSGLVRTSVCQWPRESPRLAASSFHGRFPMAWPPSDAFGAATSD
jgi:hypothetical protein